MGFFNGCTGDAQSAFVSDFSVIPNNTSARAAIKSIQVVESDNKYTGAQKYIAVCWQLLDGDFKGREVTQKIKCFQGEEAPLQRARNMLLLIMNLCQFKMTHDLEPTTFDLLPMTGKMLGIKIREWSMPKQDGSGMLEGNFISEVHPLNDYWITETGIKLVAKKPVSSQSNIPNIADSDESLPF